MTEPVTPAGATSTLPPSANGSAPPPAPASRASRRRLHSRRLHSRVSGARIALIAGAVALVVVLIFIIQNANDVSISLLGAHLRLPLAVALLFAAIAGALIMAAAGTARITELRRIMRRDRQHGPADR